MLTPGAEALFGFLGRRPLVLAQVRAAGDRLVAAVGLVRPAAGDHAGVARRVVIDVAAVVVVVGADVTGHLGPLALVGVRLDDGHLHDFAAGAVDRVGDVGVELGPAVVIAGGAVLVQVVAAAVAVAGAEVILGPAARAAVGELAAGHGHEQALGALDDFQVPDDEGVVEGDRAEGHQALVVLFDQLDADFGDDHSGPPLFLWRSLRAGSGRGTCGWGTRRRRATRATGRHGPVGPPPDSDTGQTGTTRTRSRGTRPHLLPATGGASRRPSAPARTPAPGAGCARPVRGPPRRPPPGRPAPPPRPAGSPGLGPGGTPRPFAAPRGA